MEPTIMIAIFVSCGVAVGAGVFVAIQGSKKNNQDEGEE
jgi:hypothetical protein